MAALEKQARVPKYMELTSNGGSDARARSVQSNARRSSQATMSSVGKDRIMDGLRNHSLSNAGRQLNTRIQRDDAQVDFAKRESRLATKSALRWAKYSDPKDRRVGLTTNALEKSTLNLLLRTRKNRAVGPPAKILAERKKAREQHESQMATLEFQQEKDVMAMKQALRDAEQANTAELQMTRATLAAQRDNVGSTTYTHQPSHFDRVNMGGGMRNGGGSYGGPPTRIGGNRLAHGRSKSAGVPIRGGQMSNAIINLQKDRLVHEHASNVARLNDVLEMQRVRQMQNLNRARLMRQRQSQSSPNGRPDITQTPGMSNPEAFSREMRIQKQRRQMSGVDIKQRRKLNRLASMQSKGMVGPSSSQGPGRLKRVALAGREAGSDPQGRRQMNDISLVSAHEAGQFSVIERPNSLNEMRQKSTINDVLRTHSSNVMSRNIAKQSEKERQIEKAKDKRRAKRASKAGVAIDDLADDDFDRTFGIMAPVSSHEAAMYGIEATDSASPYWTSGAKSQSVSDSWDRGDGDDGDDEWDPNTYDDDEMGGLRRQRIKRLQQSPTGAVAAQSISPKQKRGVMIFAFLLTVLGATFISVYCSNYNCGYRDDSSDHAKIDPPKHFKDQRLEVRIREPWDNFSPRPTFENHWNKELMFLLDTDDTKHFQLDDIKADYRSLQDGERNVTDGGRMSAEPAQPGNLLARLKARLIGGPKLTAVTQSTDEGCILTFTILRTIDVPSPQQCFEDLNILFKAEGSVMYTQTRYWASIDRAHGIVNLQTCQAIGNGVVVYGSCVCNEGWKGEVCDESTTEPETAEVNGLLSVS